MITWFSILETQNLEECQRNMCKIAISRQYCNLGNGVTLSFALRLLKIFANPWCKRSAKGIFKRPFQKEETNRGEAGTNKKKFNLTHIIVFLVFD